MPMQTLNSSPSPSPSSSSGAVEPKQQNPNGIFISPSSSVTRLWRPAAQRNLRNQWSRLVSQKQQWISASSMGRSYATSLVNAYLSQRYMPAMDLGVLTDMPDIRLKASMKLARQQELHQRKVLSSYKDMIAIVNEMFNTCSSMRCFLKVPGSSPLIKFSSHSEDGSDSGDGGGLPVFTFWSIQYFENLGQELVQMFALELSLKRLLVFELLSIEATRKTDGLCWSDELYPGEFDDLSLSNLYSKETNQPVSPRMKGWKSDTPKIMQSKQQLDHDVLQVYLTAWLAEPNIDIYRVDEIFAIVGEEMHVTLS